MSHGDVKVAVDFSLFPSWLVICLCMVTTHSVDIAYYDTKASDELELAQLQISAKKVPRQYVPVNVEK